MYRFTLTERKDLSYHNSFSVAQILQYHPILQENMNARVSYYYYLEKLMRLVEWDQEKYIKSELAFYRENLCNNTSPSSRVSYIWLQNHLLSLIPFDVAALIGFHSNYQYFTNKITLLKNQYANTFGLTKEQADFFSMAVQAATSGNSPLWSKLLQGADKLSAYYVDYLLAARKNADFVNCRPMRVLVTATMSAGKSTLINALTGKKISKTQKLACTSKVHVILSKPFEDSYITEYDGKVLLDATQEDLLTDNEENRSDQITVSTYFQSELGGKRILLLDTPGVNASEYAEHSEITQKVIRSKQYDLLLYVLNATQLRTTDDQKHLRFIAQHCDDKQIVFVLNKADQLFTEEEDLTALLHRQCQYLESLGFAEPLLLPISAKAVCLVQKSMREELNRIGQYELDNYLYNFAQMNFIAWDDELCHRLHIPVVPHADDDKEELLHDCGFTALETVLNRFLQKYGFKKEP